MARCPVCKVQVRQHQVAGVTAQRCANCGGFWLPPEKLERIVVRLQDHEVYALGSAMPQPSTEKSAAPTAKSAAAKARPAAHSTAPFKADAHPPGPRHAEHHAPQRLWCVTCAVEMRKRSFSFAESVEIDFCDRCHNAWIDPPRLARAWREVRQTARQMHDPRQPRDVRSARIAHQRAALREELALRKAEREAALREIEAGMPLSDRLGIAPHRGPFWWLLRMLRKLSGK